MSNIPTLLLGLIVVESMIVLAGAQGNLFISETSVDSFRRVENTDKSVVDDTHILIFSYPELRSRLTICKRMTTHGCLTNGTTRCSSHDWIEYVSL